MGRIRVLVYACTARVARDDRLFASTRSDSRSTSWMAWRFPVAGRDHSHAIQILFLSPIHGVTERPDRLTSLAWQLR